jgi:hypothetical protein
MLVENQTPEKGKNVPPPLVVYFRFVSEPNRSKNVRFAAASGAALERRTHEEIADICCCGVAWRDDG